MLLLFQKAKFAYVTSGIAVIRIFYLYL